VQATVDVLEVLLGTEESRWGLEIIKLTGRPSGSVYPLPAPRWVPRTAQ